MKTEQKFSAVSNSFHVIRHSGAHVTIPELTFWVFILLTTYAGLFVFENTILIEKALHFDACSHARRHASAHQTWLFTATACFSIAIHSVAGTISVANPNNTSAAIGFLIFHLLFPPTCVSTSRKRRQTNDDQSYEIRIANETYAGTDCKYRQTMAYSMPS